MTNGNAVYRTATTQQPAPANQILESRTYYVGNQAGNCVERVVVTVTVNVSPAPVSNYGNVFSPCISAEDNTHLVSDLLTGISPASGYTLVVFQSEFGTTTYNNTDALVAGQSYFVGQELSGECPSRRIAIRYSPDLTEAPTAEAQQIFARELP